MIAFRRVPAAEVAAKHQAAPRVGARPKAPRPPLNLMRVLDLGGVVYFTYRGHAYGVPPVSWRLGQTLLAVRHEAQAAAGDGLLLTPDGSGAYFRAVRKLADLCWRHCRPASPWQRWAKRLGLARNHFRAATEAEVVAITDFFCSRRMTANVGFPDRQGMVVTTGPTP